MPNRKNIKGGGYTPSRGKFKGITFKSRRQYENAVAQTKGFTNKSQRNAAPKNISFFEPPSMEAFNSSGHGRAVAAYRLVRNEHLPLGQAAKKAGTTPANVRRYFGDSLEKNGPRFISKPVDFAVIPMHIATVDGDRIAYIVGSQSRSLVGEHSAAVGNALKATSRKGMRTRVSRDQAERNLARFKGDTITSADGKIYELISNYDDVIRLFRQGRLHADSPYDDTQTEAA